MSARLELVLPEYPEVRQEQIYRIVARCIPSVKRAVADLLGTDELEYLRHALDAVVDQYISRAVAHRTPVLHVVPKSDGSAR